MIAFAADASEVPGETASELARLFQMILTKIPLWIAAFIIILLSIVVAKIVRKIVENKMAEKGIEEEHQELQILGGRITYMVILTIGITVALKIAGIDLTTILAAVAFGIGFALKDLIMNFLAGIMILVGRHFTIGDFINVGGTVGKVVEIQSRVTVLQAIDGTRVIVPNSELFKNQVTSFTSNPFRRLEVPVGVEYRSDLENVVKVCMSAIKKTKGILIEPKPGVLVDEFGESSINLKIRAWVDAKAGWLKIKSALVMNIKKEFDKYNIVIPWPIRTVIYDKDQDYVEKIIEEEKITAEVTSPAFQVIQTPETAVVVPAAAQTVPVTAKEEENQPLKPLGEQR